MDEHVSLDPELKEMVRMRGMTAVLRSLCNVVKSERQEPYIQRLYCDLWTALDKYELRYSFAQKMGNDNE